MSASTTIKPPEVLPPVPPVPPVDQIAGLEPIVRIRRRWPTVLAGLVTILMVIGLGHELFDRGLVALKHTVPANPLYYVAFLAFYMAPPIFDWVIFRRLWGLPAAGLGALLKKRVANEVVVGYSGEAYFYAWARERLKMVSAPFGAVKDVMILSAMAGNAITLTMLLITLPLAHDLLTPTQYQTGLWSAGVVVAMTLPFILFSRRVYSLDRKTLWWIFAVHCLRICSGSFLIALAWHYAMPGVSLAMWLFLAAGRMLVSRLPLVPNKDLLFANFAIVLIGQGQQLSELIAFTAAMTLLGHLICIVGFGIGALTRRFA